MDRIHYPGERVKAYRFANNMQASTVDELRAELARISGEHQVLGDGLDVPAWVNEGTRP